MTFRFPEIIDSTMLVAARACAKKFEYEFVRNLASPHKSVDLHFGGAFAKGMEVARKAFFVRGESRASAEAAGMHAAWQYYGSFDDTRDDYSLDKKPKSWRTLLLALDGYFREWPLGECGLLPLNGKEGIEFSFGIPLEGTAHPDTGAPIIYAGRFDMLGEWNSMPCIVDEKTASSFSTNWASQWSLRNQFLGYTWAARHYGIPVGQVIVRGVAIQKTDIKFLQAGPILMPDFMLARFEIEAVRTINALCSAYREGHFSFNLGDSCNSYGGCSFMDLCKSKTPSDWFSMFVERNWDPLRADAGQGEA